MTDEDLPVHPLRSAHRRIGVPVHPLLVVPVALIFWRSFEHGLGQFWEWITTPAAISALQLSLLIVAIVVPLNVVFGVATALALTRGNFPGKGLLQSVVDLPFAVSPVVAGVALILLWGHGGWFGGVESLGFRVIFRIPRPGTGDAVRDAAIRRARSRAGAPRSGPSRSRPLPHRCQRVADVQPHHPARDPLGPDLVVVLTIARSLGGTARSPWSRRTTPVSRRR